MDWREFDPDPVVTEGGVAEVSAMVPSMSNKAAAKPLLMMPGTPAKRAGSYAVVGTLDRSAHSALML